MNIYSSHSFLKKISNEIHTIESRLDKMLPKENPSKLLRLQQGRIKELQESLSSQRATLPEKYQEKAAHLEKNLNSILKKTEELKLKIIKGKSQKDPGFYKLIEENHLEDGTQYIFLSIDIDPEGIMELILEIYPAIVNPIDIVASDMKEKNTDEMEALRQLGYEFDFDKDIIALPDCNLLNANCRRIEEKYPGLKSFKVVSSEGVSEDLEFIKKFTEGKYILSNDIEFTHDHLIHLIPEILLRIQSDKNFSYEDVSFSREGMKEIVKQFLNFRKITEDQIEKLSKDIELKKYVLLDLKQITTIFSIIIDELLIGEKPESRWKMIDYILRKIDNIYWFEFKPNSPPIFNKTYPDDPLTKEKVAYFQLLLQIILYPQIVKFEDKLSVEMKLETIQKDLNNIDVIKNDDFPHLSFKLTGEGGMLNVEDHPFEVIQLVRNAMKMT